MYLWTYQTSYFFSSSSFWKIWCLPSHDPECNQAPFSLGLSIKHKIWVIQIICFVTEMEWEWQVLCSLSHYYGVLCFFFMGQSAMSPLWRIVQPDSQRQGCYPCDSWKRASWAWIMHCYCKSPSSCVNNQRITESLFND